MKKLLSVFLVLVFALSFVACGEKGDAQGDGGVNESSSTVSTTGIFARPRTINTVGGVSEKRTLANTYKCLTVDKELDILYIGGSLTQGAGSTKDECWRAYTTKWFKEAYPSAKITEINATLGGSGSLWGLARTQRDVIDKKPDLVFIEFAINDSYEDLTRAQAAAYMEGMVRKINTALPNTDIIFVLTTDDYHIGKSFATLEGHKIVADFYGITYINVGDALVEPVKAASWSKYAADNVHLNAEGYRIYADEVIKNLKTMLAEAKDKSAAEHKLPEGYVANNPADKVTLMEADAVAALNAEQWRYLDGKPLYWGNKGMVLPKEDNATLKIEFEGTVLSLFGDKVAGSEIIFKVDGVEAKKIDASYEKKREIMCIDNLNPGHHTVEIIVPKKGIKLDALIIG